MSVLKDADLVGKLFSALAERYKTRQGGYARVLKAGFRFGDNAPLAIIELVDRDESAKGPGFRPGGRRRRSSSRSRTRCQAQGEEKSRRSNLLLELITKKAALAAFYAIG